MKPIKLFTLPVIVLLFASCSGNDNDYDANGSFEATEIIVSSQGNGQILSLNVVEGQIVQAGEVVGQLDTTQLYLQKMSLISNAQGVRAQRPNIGTQTAAIEKQIQTLQRERTRTQNLVAANAANKKQLDDINAQIEVLQKQLSAQTSTLQKSSDNISAQSSALQIQVAQLEDLLEKCTIKSPISGVVLNKYAERGELAGTGSPLFKVADIENMYLRAYVTNDQLSGIKLNGKVTVRVDAGDGEMRSYSGTVSWISDKSEFTPKTIQTKNERANLVYATKIAVKNDGFLKIGMYGEVKF
ncbi:MAG TPA: HlyD family efflux transporter periplasmic adaptor subunit [Petrimonas sp.]|uniref:HlyD family secretion protein n=1 Tax=Petrimonas sp. TaxID=2023866 RepID=UPI0017555C12|nr:HlyD family efflux transporter periplasmic adaptor subunit [Petrimonas sp.]MEA4979976.1 HlyD family efflux transporter periplasmic adaptor subunit [Petrimonas sp.]MEA5045705.1 HlyD family efflux transporter periplasmic adaptor subunit [Petrimonas sp.]MEA5063128.1 HlyD family efflux transporter periplasmic adaptor subunit [Petrimonas sp.]HHV85488.1 HlyD family efflux transporter periplasmic adaptor subunit [Petrimonas sp.]